MPEGIRKIGDVWKSDICFNGRRVRQSFGKCTQAEAERARDELRARLWKDSPGPHIIGPSWEGAKIKWIEAAPRPVQELLSLQLFDTAFPNRPLIECTREAFEKALDDLAARRKWTASTYNRYLTRVVAIANLSGVVLKIPKKKMPARSGSSVRVLTGEEWETLYAQCPSHMQPMVKFGLFTGLRQSNVTQLRWDHVDLKREMVWVDPENAKEREPISIALSDEAVDVLRAQRKSQDERKSENKRKSEDESDKTCAWVFPYRDKPIRNVNHAWHLAMERAGLGHYERWADAAGKLHEKWHGEVVWHTLRHTWASWQRVAGTPLEDVQALGGWKDARSVQRYAHVNVDHLRRAAKNIKPWDREEPARKQGQV